MAYFSLFLLLVIVALSNISNLAVATILFALQANKNRIKGWSSNIFLTDLFSYTYLTLNIEAIVTKQLFQLKTLTKCRHQMQYLPASNIYDLVIIGAGMVGASLASALNSSGLRILLLDKYPIDSKITEQDKPDLRVSSINLGAIRWLKQQGIWQQLKSKRLQKFERLSAYEQGGAKLNYQASDINEDYLGYFVENKHLQLAANKQANCEKQQVNSFSIKKTGKTWHIKVNDEHSEKIIKSRFIVGADGANSQVKKALNFAQYGWQYSQSCLSVNILFKSPQQDQHKTWQEFRPQGPIAFLPLFENYASLICYDDNNKIKHFENQTTSSLKPLLEQAFSKYLDALGDFDIVDFACFPLTRRTVKSPMKQQALLIGDAAHNIHPLTGQGVNLGLRDASAAAHTILDKLNQGLDWTEESNWQVYLKQRKLDVQMTSSFMDMTTTLFCNESTPLKHLRKIMLNSLDKIPLAKKNTLHFALGLNNKLI